jgi:hypothetical protein
MGIDTGSDRGFKVATLGTDTWNKNGHGWTDSANGGKFLGVGSTNDKATVTKLIPCLDAPCYKLV